MIGQDGNAVKTVSEQLREAQALLSTACNEQRSYEAILGRVRKWDWATKGGCQSCGGRGWVVTWDTLDSMSGCYAEFGSCPAGDKCTAKEAGPDPSYRNKYDRIRNTPTAMLADSDEEKAWLNFRMDRTVEAQLVVKRIGNRLEARHGDTVIVARGRKVPKGTMGVVFYVRASSYSGNRLGFKDANENVFWINSGNVEVVAS